MSRQWSLRAIWARSLDGPKQGILFGVAYSVYLLIILILRGPAFFSGQGIGLGEIVALYLAGGLVVGAICGGLQPFTNTLIGRIVVGVIAALPFASLLGLTVLPAEDVSRNLVPVALAAALLWGIIGGAMFWYTRDARLASLGRHHASRLVQPHRQPLPLDRRSRRAAMTRSTTSLATSTSENRSVISIAPVSSGWIPPL